MLGAAGGIGQPLSLLLKADPLVSGLSLYDVVNTPGVAADLSHCNTPATVTGVTGVGNAEEALKGADVVVIPAGSSFGVVFFTYGVRWSRRRLPIVTPSTPRHRRDQ